MTAATVLSLGSNLGDRAAHLAAGLQILDRILGLTAVSDIYQTDPVGGVEQPAYLNLIALTPVNDPWRALAAAHAAEDARGRLRGRRWGPRTLDVDVIAVPGCASADPRLTLPHPRAHERAFVLRPWLDLDPEAWLPARGPVWRLVRDAGGEVRRCGPPPRWWR